jgi:hypothetical protein
MSRYRYFNGDTKHPYEFKACPTCLESSWIQVRRTFCSRRCARLGSNNPGWLGEDAGYMASHGRVYRDRGTADFCSFGNHEGPYEWANLLRNHPDTADYAAMCIPCHRAFDGAKAKCFDYVCSRGHSFERDGYYSKITPKGEVRQCKQCAKDRAKERRDANRV